MTRPHLTIAPTPEQAWAARTAGLDLPAELDGQTIQWGLWKPQIRILGDHGFDQTCNDCGADVTQQAHTTGRAIAPWARPGVAMVRYGADACLACRYVVVLDLFQGDRFHVDLDPVEVWVNRGQQGLF